MHDDHELADQPADVALSAPELLGKGYRDYLRYHLTIKGADGAPIEQQRDLILTGKAVLVLPIDVARDEVVLIRQFRLAAHLSNGKGMLIETVAGRTEAGETPAACARRECAEEIGVAPSALVELFRYLPTPGLTDEEIIMFVAAVDASRVVKVPASPDGEQIETLRVSIDAALAALTAGTLHEGPLIVALQWLALNRGRLAELLHV
jgi:ADP-ribose pyrophosphatase